MRGYHGRGGGIARERDKDMDIGYQGLFGLLVLAGDVWAIINIAQSGATNVKKLVWILVVLLLPLLGLVIWFFAGPRGGKS